MKCVMKLRIFHCPLLPYLHILPHLSYSVTYKKLLGFLESWITDAFTFLSKEKWSFRFRFRMEVKWSFSRVIFCNSLAGCLDVFSSSGRWLNSYEIILKNIYLIILDLSDIVKISVEFPWSMFFYILPDCFIIVCMKWMNMVFSYLLWFNNVAYICCIAYNQMFWLYPHLNDSISPLLPSSIKCLITDDLKDWVLEYNNTLIRNLH